MLSNKSTHKTREAPINNFISYQLNSLLIKSSRTSFGINKSSRLPGWASQFAKRNYFRITEQAGEWGGLEITRRFKISE